VIGILVPTNRPQNIQSLIDSWSSNNGGKSKLLFGLDTKKSPYPELENKLEGDWPDVCPMLEDMYQHFKSDTECTMFMCLADDIRFSKNFDVEILEEVERCANKMGHRKWIVYGNDTLQGQILCTHWAMTREYLDALGFLAPKGYMNHCYLDNLHMNLGLQTGTLRYLPWVVTEHLCSQNGKAEADDNTKKIYDKLYFENDRIQFERWAREHYAESLKRLS